MTSLLQNLQFAFRSLRKAPAFALTVVATLAIGIGLNEAIFTVVDNVLLRPLGYRDADRIVALRTHFNNENRSIPRLSGKDYEDLLSQVHGLECIARYGNSPEGISLHGTSLYTAVASVSPQFMEVLGVQPLAGRLFNPADLDGKDALVSASFVRDSMNTTPAAALGQTIRFEGSLYTVAGVLPEGFTFPARTQVWFEIPMIEPVSSRSSYDSRVIAKRRPGVSQAALDAELAHFTATLQRTYDENRHKSFETVSLQEQLTGRIRPTLNLLMGAVGVVLLIVCANLMHLLLVRATRTLRATTIRTALGASRATLAAGALAETAILAALGTAAAILLAVPALRLLVRLAPPLTPRLAEVHLNLDVIAFSFVVALAVMVLAALIPVWRSWHIDPATALRADSARATESPASLRLRGGFIVTEVALTLSVAAILLTRQLIAQSHQDLGFAPESLLTLDAHTILATPTPAFTDADEAAYSLKLAQLDALLQATTAVPGVTSAAAIAGAPMGFGGSDASFAIKGVSDFGRAAIDFPNADMRHVTPGAFTTLGVPLLQGRFFSPNDRLNTPPVVLINQALAAQSFPGQNPLGKQLRFGYDKESSAAWATIVGVVGDMRSESPAALPRPTVYLPIAQHPREASNMQLLVRTSVAPEAMIHTLEASLLKSHPEVAIASSTMRRNIGDLQQAERFRTTLFTLFAAVSILLAAIGMYGVTAQRRFEFGLRVALGATRAQVLTLVLGNAAAVAGLGIAAVVLLSLALTRLVADVVGKLPGFDPIAYALAAAASLPSRRSPPSCPPAAPLRSSP